jgi:hypothetical protein
VLLGCAARGVCAEILCLWWLVQEGAWVARTGPHGVANAWFTGTLRDLFGGVVDGPFSVYVFARVPCTASLCVVPAEFSFLAWIFDGGTDSLGLWESLVLAVDVAARGIVIACCRGVLVLLVLAGCVTVDDFMFQAKPVVLCQVCVMQYGGYEAGICQRWCGSWELCLCVSPVCWFLVEVSSVGMWLGREVRACLVEWLDVVRCAMISPVVMGAGVCFGCLCPVGGHDLICEMCVSGRGFEGAYRMVW